MNDGASLILELKDVHKTFGPSGVHVLQGISFLVERGEFIALRGPSGSGKSTVLNVISGLIEPTSGGIIFDGKPLRQIRNKSLYRRENIGFIFQDLYLYPGLAVLDNVLLPLSTKMFFNAELISKAKGLLEEMGLGDQFHQDVNTLSTGERQRVCIARALLNDPKLILADEPTGCLDTENTDRILEIMSHIHRHRSTTVIMVTHDDHVAEYADRQVHIVDGHQGA